MFVLSFASWLNVCLNALINRSVKDSSPLEVSVNTSCFIGTE
jgi:hypothetical protein